jgi:preprotein translocase subunit SecA
MSAVLLDDKIWWNTERKLTGIAQETAFATVRGGNVLVLSHFERTLSAVETALRTTNIEPESFSLDAAELCESSLQSTGRVWIGLARAFHTPSRQFASASSSEAQERRQSALSIIVAEHHPLGSRDEQLIQTAQALSCSPQICFHLALDDPLLVHFSGDSIQKLFRRMGADEETSLSHSFVTTAIRRGQEKIEREVPRDLTAQSIDDWFKYNLPRK